MATDPIIRSMVAEKAYGSIYGNQYTDAAKAAHANRIARSVGIAPDLVEAAFPDMMAEERLQRASAHAKANPGYALMMSNPRFAAAAIDDRGIAPLATAAQQLREGAKASDPRPHFADRLRRHGPVGAVLRSLRDTVWSGISAGASGLYSVGTAIAEAPGPLDIIGLQTRSMGKLRENNVAARATRSAARRTQESATRTQVQYENWYVNQAARGFESVPTQIAALLAARTNPGAALSLLSAVSGGQSYAEAREAGLSPERAASYGAGQASFEAVGEMIPILRYADDALRGSGFMKRLGGQLVAENVGEQITGHLQDFNTWVTLEQNQGKTFEEYLAERPGAALAIAVSTTAAAGAQTTGAYAIEKTVERIQRRNAERQEADFLGRFMDAAGKAQTRTASPGEFEEVLGQQLGGTPAETIHVPVEAVRSLFQSEVDLNDDPFWSAYSEQIAEAEALGGDVVIPTAAAATYLAGTPQWEAIKDHVRLSPGGSSRAELTEAEAAFDDANRQTGEELAAVLGEERERAEPVEKVYEGMRDKLMLAGFTPDVASNLAIQFAQRTRVRAERLGKEVTGEEVNEVEVRQILPPKIASIIRQAKVPDKGLREVIDEMKRGRGTRTDKQKFGPSLLDWIRKEGGIEDRGGYIASMGAGKRKGIAKKGQAKIIRPHVESGGMFGGGQQNANSPDELAMRAWEAGYFPEFADRPSVNDLFEAIEEGLSGRDRFAESRQDEEDDLREAAQELYGILDQQGIDPEKATPAQIARAVERYQSEMMQGRALDQPVPQTDTPEFKAWFGDSKVVDANGDPLVVYHGSPDARFMSEDSTFKSSMDRYGAGDENGAHWFARDRRAAVTYADDRRAFDYQNAEPAVVPAYLKIENPLVIDAGGKHWREAQARGKTRDVIDDARDGGHDGVIIKNVRDDYQSFGENKRDKTTHTYVAFQSTQIKSATDNAGTFDPNNPSILFQTFADGPRGRITFTSDGRSVIDLFDARDLSTFIHESGHLYLEQLKADASLAANIDTDQARQLSADWQQVIVWFKDNGYEINSDGTIPTEAHELFARGFERYTMEGKAPSTALRRAFEAFRSWLLNIYKVVDNLRAPITPEIRDVMARLMATDEEIEAAAGEQQIKALFSTAEEAGMTEAEFGEYQKAAEESRDEAFDALLYRTTAPIRAARTKEFKEREASVKAEVAAELDAMPVYTAIRLMRSGEDGKPIKLSKAWLEETYGEGILSELPGSLYAKDGVEADVIADMAGFTSGEQMIEALIGHAETKAALKEQGDKRSVRQAAIDEITAERMAERYGDPLRDGSIEAEARALIHNDKQGEIIASEVRALGRRSGNRPTPYAIARRWAREKIHGGEVADVISGASLQRYQRSARKAAKAAEAAMLAGDVDEAFRQKQAQMLNNALISEGAKAKEAVDAAVERLSKTARRKTAKSIDQDYLDQAHQLLEGVEFRDRSQRDINKQIGFEEWAAEQRASGIDVLDPPGFALGQRHWSRMTVEQIVGLDETVKQILHLGRLKQTLLDGQERRARDEVIAEMRSTTGNVGKRPPTALNDPSRSFIEGSKSKLLGFDASMIKIEQLVDWLDAGNPNGIFNRMIFKPLADAQGREADMMRDYVERVNALVDAMPRKQLRDWRRKVDTPELINRIQEHPLSGEPWVFHKDQIVMIALNWGNAGNRQRLLDGYQWSEAQVQDVLDRLLTAEDWAFVQGVWDTIDTLWPQVEALEKRVNGFAPDKIDAIPVETPYGTFIGGYFPAIYDPQWSTRADDQQAEGLLEKGYIRANVRSGATQARAKRIGDDPLLLSMQVITQHLGEVIHDITHREALTETWRLVSDDRVQRVITNALGREYASLLKPWLKHIANDNARNANSNSTIVNIFRGIGHRITIVGLGFRFMSAAAQIAGMPNIIAQIGERRMIEGWGRFLMSPLSAHREVTEKSAEMRDRFSTMDRDIVERAQQQSKRRGVEAITGPGWFTKYAYHGILIMDAVLTTAGWIGAYRKAAAEGMTDEEAVYYADKVVRKSQGAGGAKDQAAIARDHEAVKMFVKFFSYFSALYNQQRDFGHRLRRVSGAKDAGRIMHFGFWAVVAPPLVDALVRGELIGGEEEDETIGSRIAQKVFFGNAASIPGVRDIGGAIDRDFGYKATPVQNIGEAFVQGWNNVEKLVEGEEPSSRWVKQTINLFGLTFGKPTGQLAATSQFGYDVAQGDAEPENLGDWKEGITTGRIEENAD